MSRINGKAIPYILSAILMAAFVLRLKSIWFGYPLQLHPDEPVIAQSALNIISTGDLNPHNFLYPSFNIYLNALLYKTVSLFESIILGIPTDAIPEIHFYLFGRAMNVFFSTATIYVVYDIGRRLFGPWSGIAAACFIAVSSLHVNNSYYVTVDTSMAFWSTLACLVAVLIYTEGPKTSFYIAGGICAGLATGCKYTAFPAFFPIIIAHVCQDRHNGSFFNKNIIISAALFPVAFLLTTPYALLDYKSFLNALAYQKKEYSFGHPGAESFFGISLGNYCKHLFTEGYGIIPSILALVGIPLVFWQSRSKVLLLLACPLSILLFLGMYTVYFPRNVVTLIPFLSLFSGYALTTTSSCCGNGISNRMKASKPELTALVCGALLLIASISGQVISDVNIMRENGLPDTRWVSLVWCKDNIPAGTTVGREHYTPPLEKYSKKHSVVALGYVGVARKKAMLPYLDFVITSSSDYSRFLDEPAKYPTDAMAYNDFFAHNRLIKEFKGDGTSTTGPTIGIYQTNHN